LLFDRHARLAGTLSMGENWTIKMNKSALLGCVPTCFAAPANAVVVVQKTAIAAQMTELPIALSPAPANVEPSLPLGQKSMAIAIPGLLIGVLLFRLGKQRLPRPVTA